MFFNIVSEKEIKKDPRILTFNSIGEDRYEATCHKNYIFEKQYKNIVGPLEKILCLINYSLDLDDRMFKFPKEIENLSSFLQLETFNLLCELHELGIETTSQNYEIVPMVHRNKYPNSCLLVSKLKFKSGASEEELKMTLPNQIDPKINLKNYHKEAFNYSIIYGENQKFESRPWLNLKQMLKYQKLIK